MAPTATNSSGPASSGVSQARLWQHIEEMARIGAIPGGGCCREALSDADREARDLLASWCRDRGYGLRVDQIGNMFFRREGLDATAPAILIGSHLDTQPTGGRFDGVAGVLAGLEVLESLDDMNLETRQAVELVNWTNEEGSRFTTGLTGSAVWSGQLSLEDAWRDQDREGVVLRDELERIGYLGDEPARAREISAFLELHIEQGPVLESASQWIGEVNRIQNMGRIEVAIHGVEAHAGTTPMDQRQDPMRLVAAALPAVYQIIDDAAPDVRFNIGTIRIEPGAINTVPGLVRLGIDLRHPDAEIHRRLSEDVCRVFQRLGVALGLRVEAGQVWASPGLDFDAETVALLERAAERCGYPNRVMASGAGHDAMAIAQVARAAMVFVPCRSGVSHNPAEWAEPQHLAAGAHVLLEAVLELSGVGGQEGRAPDIGCQDG